MITQIGLGGKSRMKLLRKRQVSDWSAFNCRIAGWRKTGYTLAYSTEFHNIRPMPSMRADLILRRDFLRMGALGLGLPSYLSLQKDSLAVPVVPPNPALPKFGQAKSCIVLFAWGGISHVDTWDLKPEAGKEVRSIFRPIKTSVPGIEICEHLPRLAKCMEDIVPVRSVTHEAPSHRSAAYWNLTGHRPEKLDKNWPASRKDWPCIGAMVAAALERKKDSRADNGALPLAASLPYRMEDGGIANGQDGGFLGLRYDPPVFRPPHGRMYGGKSPSSGRISLDLPEGIDTRRALNRRELLKAFEKSNRIGTAEDVAAAHESRENALNLLLSDGVRDAFDLERESAATHEAYGDHICGQSVLLARRLTEAGLPIATVYCAAGDLNGSVGDHFDTHADNFNRLKNNMLPPLDQASSALIRDLKQRGLLDQTLVCWLTEFGRTPKINGGAGRDHFPNCYSVAFAGGGIRGGQVYGASDSIGYAPAEHACGPADLHATIFHALGINPSTVIQDPDGRPLALCDGNPLPLG